MDKTLHNSLLDGLQGVKQVYVKPCVKTRGLEAESLLNTSVDSTIDSGDMDHNGGGALAPRDDSNMWEE